MVQAIILMLILGGLLGLGLGVASIFLHVKPDERIEFVFSKLPGYNCGGCGYPGCQGFADALVGGDETSFKCRPCKKPEKDEIIEYLKTTPGPDGQTITIKG